MERFLKIVSLNVNGVGKLHRKRMFVRELKRVNPDVCLVQESHVESVNEGMKIESMCGYKAIWSFGCNRQYGVGILINNNLNYDIIKFDFDHSGRMVYIDVSIDRVEFRFLNIYASSPSCPDRRAFFDYIYKYCVTSHFLILAGDFNFIMDSSLDKIGGNPDSGTEGRVQMRKIIQDFDLVDAFRYLHPKIITTWRGPNVSTSIDRFYISSRFASRCLKNHNVWPCHFSDHDFIGINVILDNARSIGPGYWKFNNSILDDGSYNLEFRCFWQELIQNQNITHEWWEHAKLEIKKFTLAYCKRKSKLKNSHKRDLERRYTELVLAEYNNRGDYLDQINSIKKELSALALADDRGCLIRSKSDYLDNNEKPTKYFLEKETKRGKDKIITQLQDLDNITYSENPKLLEIARNFYLDLFTRESIDITLCNEFLADLPGLDNDESESCEGYITLNEIQNSLKNMNSDRSPGSDGLSREFYLYFLDLFGPVLVELYNSSFDNGFLCPSQRLSYITLLCKDRNNSHLMKNWRPISLLNIDYKILSKVIQRRLSSVISEIVGPDQTCSVPGRTISDNLHFIRNIIDYVKQKQLDCAFVNIDSQKAFDRVDHGFLFSALSKFNFGPSFIRWVRLLYKDVSSSVIVNGFVSELFPVTRSVRQGCSLSPLLYVLVLEPFLIRIRKDLHIRGIKIPGCIEDAKATAYADDVTGICSNLSSVEHLLATYEKYGRCSGARLNKTKTMVLAFGNLKTSTQQFGVSWVESQKILGVRFGHDITADDNWGKICNNFQRVLFTYEKRDMSIFGRANIVKVLACSKLWYVSTIVDLPAGYLKRFNSSMFKFIWGTKKFEPLKRQILFHDRRYGGLSVVHIYYKTLALRLKHVHNIINSKNVKWNYFAKYWLGHSLKNLDSSLASNSVPHGQVIPTFYKGCLTAVETFSKLYPDFVWHGECTTKQFYDLLLNSLFTELAVVRNLPQIDFNLVWRNVNNSFVDPQARSLAWRLVHDIVPTMWTLFCRRHTLEKKCAFCDQVETVEHIFYYCDKVHPLWGVIRNMVNILTLNKIKLDFKLIRYLNFPKLSKFQLEVILVLVNLAKQVIWGNRNDARFRSKSVTSQAVISQFIEKLRFRITVDKSRLSAVNFYHYWLVSGMFCDIDREKLVFNF
ncbi:hypothetical protein SNE40_004305 [Patella caerulea]|uniref:Reverse transcriptase domain-containing protein n=1 Tax=Patella caerulea TaxID=87958 RepID=A0AAN8QC84_PATCE